MKATKFVVIVAIVTVAMLSQTAEADSKSKFRESALHLTFEQAVTDLNIVQLMYQQINEGILDVRHAEYTVRVVYLDTVIYITGTYNQWYTFFLMENLYYSSDE